MFFLLGPGRERFTTFCFLRLKIKLSKTNRSKHFTSCITIKLYCCISYNSVVDTRIKKTWLYPVTWHFLEISWSMKVSVSLKQTKRHIFGFDLVWKLQTWQIGEAHKQKCLRNNILEISLIFRCFRVKFRAFNEKQKRLAFKIYRVSSRNALAYDLL